MKYRENYPLGLVPELAYGLVSNAGVCGFDSHLGHMTDKQQSVQHSATVGVQDTTLDDITAAAKKVKAASNARITTGGYYQPNVDIEGTPFSITFSWTD